MRFAFLAGEDLGRSSDGQKCPSDVHYGHRGGTRSLRNGEFVARPAIYTASPPSLAQRLTPAHLLSLQITFVLRLVLAMLEAS